MAFASRRPQSAASQFLQSSFGDSQSLTTSRATDAVTDDDPLKPLRTMADRVGKEVAKFAMRLDDWHMHDLQNGSKYQATLTMVDQFKQIADTTVKELKQQSEADNRGELLKSTRRRIKHMAEQAPRKADSGLSQSVQSVIPSVEPTSSAQPSSVQELRNWQAEAATWDLLRIIIEHYHPEPGTDVAAEKRARLANVGGALRYSPNVEIWDRFLLEDDQAKEKEIVLRWLEHTAKNSESDIDAITEQLEAESKRDTESWTSGWLDTKSKIKHMKRLHHMDSPLTDEIIGPMTSDRTEELVKRLDPDAPLREQRALEKTDEYYERSLWMVCYEMLRRGVPWKEISAWCTDKSEAWRGVSLGAAYESHPNGKPNVSGPTVGYLFRRIALYAAKGARSQYEAAVYALLSGNLKEVEPVCRSWDDHLYARYNALLLSRFDGYLLKNHPNKLAGTVAKNFAFHDAVADIPSWETSSAFVIDHLKTHKATAALSTSPMKLIQGALISRSMEELLYQVGVAIASMLKEDERPTAVVLDPFSKPSDSGAMSVSTELQAYKAERSCSTLASDPQALRVLVHISIVLRNALGLFDLKDNSHNMALNNVIVAYIECMRQAKNFQGIPIYAAQLQDNRVMHCLSRILPDIKNPDEQREFLRQMYQYKLQPVQVIMSSYLQTLDNHMDSIGIREAPPFHMLEPTEDLPGEYLWPGKRVKPEFSGLDLTPADELVLESMRWQLHLDQEIDSTWKIMASALMRLLCMGRIGAAIQLVNEMSLETLSLIKTKHMLGYAFDFMAPGSEVQDAHQLAEQNATRREGALYVTTDDHEAHVYDLRNRAQNYYDLQQLVRLIMLFREWPEVEAEMVQQRGIGMRPDTKKVKDLFESIQATIDPLLESFLETPEPEISSDAEIVKLRFMPEIIVTYLTIVQVAAYFTSRELTIKAMDIATIIADPEKLWLQRAFLTTNRMTELVELLAQVSKTMLRMSEITDKNKIRAPRRGSKGESVRIWNVHYVT